MRLAPLGLVLCAALLSGCGLGQRALAPAAAMLGGGGQTSGAAMPKSGPETEVTLSFLGQKFPMRELERDGNVITYVAEDGSQMELRDGILISTRGFGTDLMSSAQPGLAELTRGAAHKRTDFYLDGTDTMLRRDFDCTVAAGDGGKGPAGTRHIRQTCRSQDGFIVNDYWLRGGQIAQSRQWVSAFAGYAGFVAP
ncbi:hypothetical protein MASR2M74_16420 [Paracoccaceae bacterium]